MVVAADRQMPRLCAAAVLASAAAFALAPSSRDFRREVVLGSSFSRDRFCGSLSDFCDGVLAMVCRYAIVLA